MFTKTKNHPNNDNIDIKRMLKERKPQGVNTGYKSDPSLEGMEEVDSTDDIQILQVDLQFRSNLRIGIHHIDNPDLCIGIP